MRIGLYGLPTAGKTFLLNKVKCLDVLEGSSLLKEIEPDFENLPAQEKKKAREKLAEKLMAKDGFIMDGHFSFGEDVVFTEEDGKLYDTFLYLYVDPVVLIRRMEMSERNKKYLKNGIEKWQRFEIESMRKFCHENDKDFYVIDNPGEGFFSDVSLVLEFIDNIVHGYSCVEFARDIAKQIPKTDAVTLLDGDRTLIHEDSCWILGYKTNVFNGNFYTGFQSWRHMRELEKYLQALDSNQQPEEGKDYTLNRSVYGKIEGSPCILTSGNRDVWKMVSMKYHIPFFFGPQMSSDTKFFAAKFLRERGSRVIAFGDSLNDFFMLKEADVGHLVLKKDGSVSSSLKGRNLEGLVCLR